MKLKTRFFLVFSFAVVLCVVGTAFVNYIIFKNKLVDVLKKREVTAVRELTYNIDSGISKVMEAVEFVRRQRDVADFLQTGDLSSDVGTYFSMRNTLSKIQTFLPKPFGLSLLDTMGKEIVSSAPEINLPADMDFGDLSNIQPDKIHADFYATKTSYSGFNFVILAPVEQDKQVIGAVIAWIEPETIMDYHKLLVSGFSEDNALLLIDASGKTVARAGNAEFAQVDGEPVFEIIKNGKEGFLENDDSFIFYAPVPKLNAYIVSYAPRHVFYIPLGELWNLNIAILAVVLLIGIFCVRSLYNAIVPRLEQSVALAKAALSEDISGKLETGKDELETIFSTFGKMTENLLSARNTERELTRRNACLETLISDSKEEMEKTQRHTKLLLDVTGEAVIEVNPAGKIVFVNSAIKQILGFSEGDLLEHYFFDVIKHMHATGKICDAAECPLLTAVNNRETTKLYDIYIIRKSGRTIPASVSLSPAGSGDGGEGFIISIIDLSKQRAQLQEILNSSPTAMAIVRDSVVRHVNDKAIDLFGLNRGGDAEKIYADIFEREQIMSRAESGLAVKDYPAVMRGVFGQRLDVLFTVHAFEYEGKPSFVEWISDVTDLTKARVIAEDAAQARALFLARSSHEIRTPLNAIMGLSEVELRNDIPDETRANIEKIYNSGSTLLSIVNDLLDISKIDSGNFDIIPAEYDFANLISDSIHLNIVRISGKPVKFISNIDEKTPCKLIGDELRIKQILNNLLSNAFKYTRNGTVWMSVICEFQDDDAILSFSVKDTGIGLKPEDLDKIFGDYKQFDKLTNRKIEGTGLGLAICKKLVDLMNGGLHVESDYGHGSVFTVTLRQKIADPAPIGEEVSRGLQTFRLHENRRARAISRVPMPYGKVLVVDDVVTNLDVARALMRLYELTVHCLDSGRQAIETVREGKIEYDIIFMDHMMPGTDGVEAVRIIRGLGTDYANKVPIIALTANALVGNEDMFRINGFQGFLSKPIDVLKLDAILHEWIKDKRGSGAEIYYQDSLSVHPQTGDNSTRFNIDGVDVTEGISRFGNINTYLEILRTYARYTAEQIENIRDVKMENLGEYAITVHGIKGSSMNISAHNVSGMAERLEYAARDWDYGTVASHNGELITSVEKLITNINEILNSIKGAAPAKTVKPSPDKDTLARLLAACQKYDAEDMKRAVAELGKFEYEQDGELARWLIEQAENIEYDNIAEKLEQIGTLT